MLVATHESYHSDAQTQQTLSQHLFLLLHFEHQQASADLKRLPSFFAAGFLYNCPRTVTWVGESASGSSPFDNSFWASGKDWFGAT